MDQIFATSHIDAVMHFAAVAYVGESMEEPLRYKSFLAFPLNCSKNYVCVYMER